jgi:hypothetical protein
MGWPPPLPDESSKICSNVNPGSPKVAGQQVGKKQVHGKREGWMSFFIIFAIMSLEILNFSLTNVP